MSDQKEQPERHKENEGLLPEQHVLDDAGDGNLESSRLDRFTAAIQKQLLEQARETYSETVIDHWIHPRHPGPMKDANGHAEIKGSCGDTMEIFLRIESDHITDASFRTNGCGTSIASASMVVELVTGSSLLEARNISQQSILERLDGLPEESEHCALLAAETLHAALQDCAPARSTLQ